MWDYSLEQLTSRPAVVGEKLITHNFGTGTTGFVSVMENFGDRSQKTAVCLLPGTEIAFDKPIKHYQTDGKTVATFREMDKDHRHVHHDALEFTTGQVVKLTLLPVGQICTVLQLPIQTQTVIIAESADV